MSLRHLLKLAGQLGIQTANIDDFVKTIAQLGTTTNLQAEEGAQQLARFANITQMSQGDFDRLGSSIVDLGNNFATTEAEIVTMGLRLAGAGNLIGLTNPQILGICHRAHVRGHQRRSWRHSVQPRIHGNAKVSPDRQCGTGLVRACCWQERMRNSRPSSQTRAQNAALLEFINGLQRVISNGGNVHAVLEELGFR